MQLSFLIAAFVNANRDPKKSRTFEADSVSVYQMHRKKKTRPQTDLEQRKILEAVTIVLGGEVV